MIRLHSLAVILLLTIAASATARVVSYAPYSDKPSFPAIQHRSTRHFVTVEGPLSSYFPGPIAPGNAPYTGYAYGQLVVYDTRGREEPRVVLPKDGSLASFALVAMRETNELPTILIESNTDLGGNAKHENMFFLSRDGGETWKRVLIPSPIVQQPTNFDLGGPIVRQRQSPVRIGNDAFPFVLAIPGSGVYAIGNDAAPKLLIPATSFTSNFVLAGNDREGSRFLIRIGNTMSVADLDGRLTTLGDLDQNSQYEGWITPDGAAYLEMTRGDGRFLFLYVAGGRTFVAGPYETNAPVIGSPAGPYSSALTFFAVPTADYSGAWIIQRAANKPTTLSLHTRERGLQQQWKDAAGPQVEALIAGQSGNSVLIQVHRERPSADQRLFKDPALAVWHIGEPAPVQYDELYLNETPAKGFVHVDVDKLALGEPFVFDSGVQFNGGGIILSPSAPGGGSDVTQEWGIVRGSLAQRLILPGIARTAGAYGSYWLSDVIFYNPLDSKQNVIVRYVPSGDDPASILIRNEKILTFDPHEIRLIPDALKTLFSIESGGGAFFITPDIGMNVTSRTYTQSDKGTFGFGMNGIDLFAGASPRFSVSFAGALQGANFRTNLILTDVSGRGTSATLMAAGTSGTMGSSGFLRTPALGQQQFNGLSSLIGVLPTETGAVVVQPQSGETIASMIAIDNRTNDPTYFPPDLPAPFVRTIPALGHLDGANGSKFRSDLFLYNPAAQPRTVTLQLKMWDTNEQPQTLTLTMLPNEGRVIRDVLYTAFGRSGIGRLRYQSNAPDSLGVRVTSRTYSVDETGGTYGFLMPPLNNFQSASAGDTLEILGAVGDKRFRTNVGIVELASGFTPTSPAANVNVEIYDQKGTRLDSFQITVPAAGGLQINDIFRSRNLGDGPAAAMIRLSPTSGMIGAYATIIDNGTNDPTYLAAQLGAKP